MTRRLKPEDQALCDAICGKLAAPGMAQRRAMAKVITLLESTRPDHRARADAILNALLPKSGRSLRIGISGVPGAGKSTLIEALGLSLIDKGHRVAVLVIDPSSSISGGSILGDKTRMHRLSVHEGAYIRPTPSSGHLGGVAEKTREAILVAESAGHDIVIVETMGVGQSESAVADMTDMFVLLHLPHAGDELQAMKKGVMELADLVVINKSDLDPIAAANSKRQVSNAIQGRGPHHEKHPLKHDDPVWQPKAITISALKGEGIPDLWDAMVSFHKTQLGNGQMDAKRKRQNRAWMWDHIEAGLKQSFIEHPSVKTHFGLIQEAVDDGTLPASVAARQLLKLL